MNKKQFIFSIIFVLTCGIVFPAITHAATPQYNFVFTGDPTDQTSYNQPSYPVYEDSEVYAVGDSSDCNNSANNAGSALSKSNNYWCMVIEANAVGCAWNGYKMICQSRQQAYSTVDFFTMPVPIWNYSVATPTPTECQPSNLSSCELYQYAGANARPVASLTSNSATIPSGSSASLTWTCSNSTSASISSIGAVSPTSGGTTSVTPTSTTNYVLSCNGPGGTSSASSNVIVSPTPTPTATLTATNPSIFKGNSTTLNYACTDSATASISPSIGTVSPASYGTTGPVSPTVTTTYTLTCTGSGGNASSAVTVQVTTPPPVTAACNVTPSPAGTSANVVWSAVPGGGNGTYTYNWTGDVTGTSQNETANYLTANTYNSTVTITSGGVSQQGMCSVVVQSCLPTLTASPSTVNPGDSTTLTWNEPGGAACPTTCTMSDGYTGGVSGSEVVYPPNPISGNTDTYSIMCGAPANTGSTNVTVNIPLINSFTESPSRINVPSGANAVTLSWSASNSNGCIVSRSGQTETWTGTSNPGVVDPLPITSKTQYTIVCDAGTTAATTTATINVLPSYSNF